MSTSAHVPVTVVIPTLNEDSQISEAVVSLVWADEVVVVDGGSFDGTPEIARAAGARVIEHIGGTIASQRNIGAAAARNHWVLALDADERVPESLRAEVAAAVAAPKHTAYRVRLNTTYLGHQLQHGRLPREWKVRLFPREGRFKEQRVHEVLERTNDTGSFGARLEHTPYRDLSHQLKKIAQYARWGAEDLQSRGGRCGPWQLITRPLSRFVRDYFVYSGWRDGQPGLVLATLSATAVLLKYAHLLAMQWQVRDEIPHPSCPIGADTQTPQKIA